MSISKFQGSLEAFLTTADLASEQARRLKMDMKIREVHIQHTCLISRRLVEAKPGAGGVLSLSKGWQ